MNTTALSADERFVIGWELTNDLFWLPVWGTPEYIRSLLSGGVIGGGDGSAPATINDEGTARPVDADNGAVAVAELGEYDQGGGALHVPDATGMSLMDAALAYAEAGWYVLPLRPRTKRPAVGNWDENSSRDSEQIQQWWSENANYGVGLHLGRSGAIGFDFDEDDLDVIVGDGRSDMAEALRGAGAIFGTRPEGDRCHYIFATMPGEQFGNSAGAFMPYGEVRGKNGYMAVAPTPHPDADTKGGEYNQRRTGVVLPLPEVLRRCLSESSTDVDPLTPIELEQFLLKYDGDGCVQASCRNSVDGQITLFEAEVEDGSSRHEAMVRVSPWSFSEAMGGCLSARDAYEQLRTAFVGQFTEKELAGRNVYAEFDRIACWGAAQADPDRAHRDIDDEDFWVSRPVLSDIRQFARARRTSPWAMLGHALTRTICSIPPNVVLPPTIGGTSSLNLFVALVGESGDGKGASSAAAEEWLITEPPIYTALLGSGEGMAKCFAYVQKARGEPPEQVGLRDAVLFDCPEVDNLAALKNRSSSTLLPQLRLAYSGEALGFSYADPTKAIRLERHRYRLCLTLGVQPGRAAALFEDADGGTPQRFVWLPVLDPGMPDKRPEQPTPFVLPKWVRTAKTNTGPRLVEGVDRLLRLHEPVPRSQLVVLKVPQAVIAEIERRHIARHRGHRVNALDGHKMHTRLKVAAALMWLDGRADEVTDKDWDLAGVVMQMSNRIRLMVLGALRKKASRANRARGESEAERELSKAGALDDAVQKDVGRAAASIRRKLRKQNDQPRNHMRNNFGRDKRFFNPAVEHLESVGDLTLLPNEGTGGDLLHLGDGR